MEPIDRNATLDELDAVAADLAWLDPPPVFFGASVLPLYLDAPGLTDEARPTEDVDVIIAVTAPGSINVATAGIEAELRSRGWAHDQRPARKNIYAFIAPSGVPVDLVFHRADVSPEPASTIEDWPWRAALDPMVVRRATGLALRVPTPAYFFACKIAASRNPTRWSGPYDAKDVEDLALLLAGCSAMAASATAGPPALRAMLAAWASEVQGGTTAYGKTVRELLMANCPRSVPERIVVERIAELARLHP